MRKVLAFLAVVLVLALGAVVVAGAWWWWRGDAGGWTTCSRAAGAELDHGIESLQRYYRPDAAQHFARALELDPNFVVAKFFLAEEIRGDHQRLWAELEEVDLEGLTPRERFLVSYYLARHHDDAAAAEAILSRYRAQYPDDLFAIAAECDLAWWEQRYAAAERCYLAGLELHPNWVVAENRLGYVAMAQGRFREAEEHFRTYRYMAPDQANPHDSLGELLINVGRYEEAEQELREALRIRGDFCPAYEHLVRLYLYSGRPEEVAAVLDQRAVHQECAARAGFECQARTHLDYLRGDFEAAWQRMEAACLKHRGGFDLIGHRLAVTTGRLAAAEAMEELQRQLYEKEVAKGHETEAAWIRAALLHAEGVRLLSAGEFAAASARLAEVDGLIKFWSAEEPSFKFLTLLTLVYSLRLEGKTAAAEALVEQIRTVNPRIVDDLPLPDLEALLAARGTSR